jgi:glycosyltransferase Alg8
MLINYIRAYIYAKRRYPAYLDQIKSLSKHQRYPEHLYVIIPSYKEDAWVTSEVFFALFTELNQLPCKSTIVVATGSPEEDSVIRNSYEAHPAKEMISVILQRQSSGKRVAMGHMLRVVAKDYNRHNYKTSITVFMDGDTYLSFNSLKNSLPFFAIDKNLGAVTTNEVAFINSKSAWYKEWFNLKFAQRHVLFQSQSLSKRVMTLTGRFSIFRTSAIISEDFISTMEHDIIIDPSYGKFRFLMGDDKSSWYHLMKNNYHMLYLPDILVYPLESRDTEFLKVSRSLPYRWYGNTLRNNRRARKLKNQPFFIRYLLIDQVLLMWTSLIGISAAFFLAVFVNFVYLPLYFSWIILVRLFQMGIFVFFGHRVSMLTLPLMLYTQWIGAFIKIRSYFYLADQKWSKSGEVQDATKDADFIKYPFYRFYAPSRMYLFIGLFIFFIVTLYTHIFQLPDTNIFHAKYEPSKNIIFQAVTNDNKDDAPALNKLIASVPDNTTILLPKGILDIYTPLIIQRSHISIIGNDTTLLSHLKGNYKNVMSISGKRSQYLGKTVTSMEEHFHIKVHTKEPLKAGMLLLIEEDNDYNYIHNVLGSLRWDKKYPKLRSEIIEVAKYNKPLLTAKFFIKSHIDKDASIYKIDPVTDITIKNITFNSIYKSKKYNYIYKNSRKDLMINTLHLLYTSHINLQNITINNSGSSPLIFERSYDCQGKNITIDGAINKGKKGNGYLRLNKSFHITLENVSVKHIRHIVFQWASAYNRIDKLYSEVDVNFHGGSTHDNLVTNVVYNVDIKKHKWGKVYITPKNASWAPPDLGPNIVKEKK